MLPPIRKLVVQIQFDNSLSPYRSKNQIDPYLKRFTSIRNSVVSALRQFIAVEVVPKPPPQYYYRLPNKLDPTMYFDSKHGRNVHFPRKDSFEISIDNFVIFSRLKTGEWPTATLVTEWALKVASKLKNIEGDKSETFVKQQFSYPNSKIQSNNFSLPPLSINNGQQHEQLNQTINRNRTDLQQSPYSRQLVLEYDPPLRPINNSRYQYDRNSLQNKSLDRFPHEVSSHKSKRGAYASKLMNNQIQKRNKFNSLYQTINMTDVREKSRKEAFTWHFNSPAINQDVIKSKLSQHNLDESMRRKNAELEPLVSESPQQTEVITGATVNEEVAQQQQEQQQQQQEILPKVNLKLSESVINCYRDSYDISGDKITKKYNEQTWAPLLTEGQLPLQGRYYFVVSVLRSKLNMIQIGMVPLQYHPKIYSHDQTETFLCLNCGNGMIKDSREDSAESTKWRLGGQAAPRDQPFRVKVVMDLQRQLIEWRIKHNLIGSARIPKIFKESGCRMFISLYDVNDSVIFNEEQQQKPSEQSIDSPDVSLIAHSQKNDSNVLQFASESQNLERMLQSPALHGPIEQKKEAEETTKIERRDVEIQTETKGGKIVKQHLVYGDELEESREQRKWNKNSDFLKESVSFQNEDGLKWTAIYAAETSQYQLNGISLKLLRYKKPQTETIEQPIKQPRDSPLQPVEQPQPAKMHDQFDHHWETVYEHSVYKLREAKT